MTEVVAVEPEDYLRERAEQAADGAPVPITVVDGLADRLPADDHEFDAGVASLVLCSVPDQASALAELRRVIRPGGELRFYEHVVSSRPPLARVQRVLDRTVWPRLGGGCHAARDTLAAIEAAGFAVERCHRFEFRPTLVTRAVAPHVIGAARRVRAEGPDESRRQHRTGRLLERDGGPSLGRPGRALRPHVAPAFNRRLVDAADIRSRAQVLDIGCGCGHTSRAAARLVAPGKWWAWTSRGPWSNKLGRSQRRKASTTLASNTPTPKCTPSNPESSTPPSAALRRV